MSQPTHPAGRRARLILTGRRRLLLAPAAAAILVASAGTAAAIEPIPVPEPHEPIPSPAVCLSLTTVNSFTASGGPFAGGAKLTWNVTAACSVTVRLGGTLVPATGSKVVDPDKGAEYALVASMGGLSKQLGSQVVLGGDVISYQFAGRGGLVSFRNSTDPQSTEAKRITAEITTPLSASAKRKLLGKRIEVHLIPANRPLTALPPWRYLAGTSTCDTEPGGPPAPGDECEPIPWEDKRGAGHSSDVEADRVVVAAGAETLLNNPTLKYGPGYVLAHELGHLVLKHATPEESAGVEAARQAMRQRERLDDQFADRISRSSYNAEEYFAEGTAALFRYRHGDASRTMYTPTNLDRRHPELLKIVRRVYPGVG